MASYFQNTGRIQGCHTSKSDSSIWKAHSLTNPDLNLPLEQSQEHILLYFGIHFLNPKQKVSGKDFSLTVVHDIMHFKTY